jgi:GWxTD domain-containing protein
MNMKSSIVTALILFGAVSRCWGGTALDLDHACFRAQDSLGFVEVFAAIQRSSLVYHVTADSETAEFAVILQVLRDSVAVMSDTFHAVDVIDTTGDRGAPGQFFAHVFQFIMIPGDYGLRAELVQAGAPPEGLATDSVVVRPFDGDSLQVSDIELGSKLEFTDKTSPMTKNGVMIVPNPTRFFGTQLPLLFYYAECYGLEHDSTSVDSFTVTRRVLDAQGGTAARPESVKTRKVVGESAVIADGFPVATLRTGTYLLEIEVKSLRSGKSALVRKKFWTYRKEDWAGGRTIKMEPEFQAKLQQGSATIIEVMDADSALQWMRYILTKDELSRIQRLTPDGKRAFLREYWAAGWIASWRNVALDAESYFARVAEANRRYTFLKRPGWKSDRGRVFILYGEPDRVNRNYGAAETSDNETWEYDKLEGGCMFVFSDKAGYGDLDLVHSTKRGEIYNPNWSNMLPNQYGQPDDKR